MAATPLDQCAFDQQPLKQNNVQEKPVRPDSGLISSTNRSKVKLWRAVGRHEAGNSIVQTGKRETELDELKVEGAIPLFCSRDAEAFLIQRWKEAIAADHVKLILSPETEPIPSYSDRGILCSAENRLSDPGSVEHASIGATKAKFRAKAADKGSRLKYIPKHRERVPKGQR